MHNPSAILFGAIGSVVESSELQYQSFIAAFRDAGLDWVWEREAYKEMLRKPGGLERIRQYAISKGDQIDPEAIYAGKNEHFHRGLRENPPALRQGVADVIEHCRAAGKPLGFVTTTTRSTLNTLFEVIDGISAEDFSFIGDRTLVDKGKPAPDIYQLALREIGFDAKRNEVLAIEDSPSSRTSAIDAGLACVFFPGAYILDRPDEVEAVSNLTDVISV
ncbi:MAG: HAD-IA family hydrolase [Verrucomicrobiota bacterium]